MSAPQQGSAGRPALIALTPEARAALGGDVMDLTTLPFRIGRDSRRIEWTERGIRAERRDSAARPNNDLYLVEPDEPMNVSREHLQILREPEGYVLEDRGSTCGTIVEGRTVGGEHRGGRVALSDGDVVIVGSSHSPHVFKFRLR